MAAYKDEERGTWYVSFHYYDWTGKNKRKLKRGFKTRREALEWEQHFRMKEEANLEMTFDDFVEAYTKDMKPKLKENTWNTKEAVINSKILPYFKDKKMKDIKPTDIIQWQNQMIKLKNPQGALFKPTYLKTIQSELSALFNHAVRFYELKENPVVKAGPLDKGKADEMLFWTKEEYLKFIEQVKDKPVSYYAFQILYWCGLRMGELLALTPADIDIPKSMIHITKSYQRIRGKDVITMYIPTPGIEPTIRVIDTLFDKRVYFSDWVDYYDMVDDNIPKSADDYRHGTAVSSIIVDGARLNPWLNDGCGRFKVRHFGVAVGSKFSSFTIIKQIKEIIGNNRDIKVWNISLGSNQEINDNFVSAEAAVLDQIQYEYNVIFVIAGTNKPNANVVKIGSPADSINSMVVNAVSKNGLSTKYARKGLALSFFAKPDISYYGGSEEQYIKVCEPLGAANVAGTSFAAPWISRKLSYLIDILGFNREVAKAMIIDAARGWNEKPTPEIVALYGHGVVPIKIDEVIQTTDDEIKFVVSDVSEKWNTYNYHFPVPIKDDKYPFIAKATMCYFPLCNRTQGVDYTNTELNLHFGRIDNKGKIKDIKGDSQNQDDTLEGETNYLLEGDARDRFRKWDNVKYIAERPKDRMVPKISYNNKNWGMEIKTNNRLDPKDGIGIRFGVVVTLKEINGINRIDEFIKSCTLNGWLVNVIDVQNRIDINKKINEDIELE